MRKLRFLGVLFGLYFGSTAFAQELYVYTEPASNMPAKSIGVRLSTDWMDNVGLKNRSSAELMVGVNKNLMLHAQGYFSNINQSYAPEGGSFYAKVRVLSIDEIQSHFRAAVFAKAAYSKQSNFTHNINLDGGNSGWQSGLVLTQLIHKLAVSATVSYSQEFDKLGEKYSAVNFVGTEIDLSKTKKAFNYSLSSGYLLLPFVYKDYNQPNFNLYLELLGQSNKDLNASYLDLAPAVQFILNSRTRIDLGYRFELNNKNMTRDNKNMFLARVEFNFFNALSKTK
ncbi:MAG: hypothetical protein EOO99_00180 [Pedobacter sp.]|nr:MAG: hypothetical protein EOO99_00180 [Pedobacter sp.]